jgi:hypothetical protein
VRLNFLVVPVPLKSVTRLRFRFRHGQKLRFRKTGHPKGCCVFLKAVMFSFVQHILPVGLHEKAELYVDGRLPPKSLVISHPCCSQ